MIRYALRRIAALVPIWLLISTFAFLVATLAPGDPALAVARRQSAEPPTAEEIAQVRSELRLDDPVLVRFGRWVTGAVRGDLGVSYRGEPVLATLAARFAATLQVALPALLLSILVALPLGAVSAARQGTLVDHASRAASLLGASMPSFCVGYLLIILFSVKLHLLPVAGQGGWRHAVMPTLTLTLGAAAGLIRLTRASLLDVLGEDFVRTARAKGLREWRVISAHALRNSLVVVVTALGIRFARLLAGAAIVETVFSWPGIGRYIVEAIHDQDFPAVQGFVLFAGTVFVVVNLAVDLLLVRLDPRITLVQARSR